MVLNILTAIGIGVITGGLAGALSSYLGWNASNAPFERKKFVSALATGVIAATTLVFMNVEGFKIAVLDLSGLAFVELLGTIVFSTLGIDFFREKISGIIANRPPTQPLVS